jgi:hypothetical protein
MGAIQVPAALQGVAAEDFPTDRQSNAAGRMSGLCMTWTPSSRAVSAEIKRKRPCARTPACDTGARPRLPRGNPLTRSRARMHDEFGIGEEIPVGRVIEVQMAQRYEIHIFGCDTELRQELMTVARLL